MWRFLQTALHQNSELKKVGLTFTVKFQSMSILVIRCNRQQETGSLPKYTLQKQKWTINFDNSFEAKTNFNFNKLASNATQKD